MSRLGMDMLMGVPSVWPSKTPERICTTSVSFRWVTMALWPGTRRSRSGWMSASDRGRRAGQPSTTAPTPAPCDSPHVVTRNSCPQVLPTPRGYPGRRLLRLLQQRQHLGGERLQPVQHGMKVQHEGLHAHVLVAADALGDA